MGRSFWRVAALALSLSAASWGQELKVSGAERVKLYHGIEFDLSFPVEAVRDLSQVHDACDADQDGRFFDGSGVFVHAASGEEVRVPAFFMRDRPGGEWRLRLRFGPRRPGEWRGRALARFSAGGPARDLRSADFLFSCDPTDETGPLVAPEGEENPRYLRFLTSSGRRTFFGLAVARPWVVNDTGGDWPDECIDRETELFQPMREAGANLLTLWMAPWELMLVHQDRAEWWPARGPAGEEKDGHFTRVPLGEESWRPFAAFDQGRAAALDRIFRQAERFNPQSSTHIYLALSIFPHKSLQVREHPYSGGMGGWRIGDADGLQKINGFSAFRPPMSVYDFFRASPDADPKDWRRQLWGHHANLFRYLVARWGHSRSLAMWVIVDEIDSTTDQLGHPRERKGWWSLPEPDRWHDNVLRLFRGGIQGFPGDPYRHPVSTSVSSFGYRADPGQVLWDGAGEKVDVHTFNVYPVHYPKGTWRVGEKRSFYLRDEGQRSGVYSEAPRDPQRIPADTETWAECAALIRAWGLAAPGKRPFLMREFGYKERDQAADRWDIYGKKYPTILHYAAWASLVCGHASTPAEWNDGKAFGEMRWRSRPGTFSRDRYPVDNYSVLSAIGRFLRTIDLADYEPMADGRVSAEGPVVLWCLASKGDAALGWAFVSRRGVAQPKALAALGGFKPAGLYRLAWFNTWTGDRLRDTRARADGAGRLSLDVGTMMAESVIRPLDGANDFENNPADTCDDGKDVAFQITPAGAEARAIP